MGNLSWFQICGLFMVTSSLAAGQILFKYASRELQTDQGAWVFLLSLSPGHSFQPCVSTR